MAPTTAPWLHRHDRGMANLEAVRVTGCSGDGIQILKEVIWPAAVDELEDVVRVEMAGPVVGT